MAGPALDLKTSPIRAATNPTPGTTRSEAPDTTLLSADYGFLPRDHTIVTNLNARLQRLFPDVPPNELPEVRVLASLGMSANAFCHEDGVLIVTPELLTLLRYEEELDAILKHEGIHYRDAHIAESRHLLENEKSVARYFGSRRHHEIETDAKSFIEMADVRSQTNSFGYISLLETLLALPEGAQAWDPDHGRLTDRILNLRLLTSGYELSPGTHPLDHLSERGLTPIAATLQESANAITARGGKIGELLRPVSPDPRHWDAWVQSMQTKVEEATRDQNLPLLVAATNALVPRLVELLAKDKPNDSHSTHSIRYQGTYDLLKKLLSAIETTQGASDPVRNALTAGLLISPAHCQALNRKHQGSGKPALQQASEFIKIANNLTPDGLREIPSTIQRILDSGVQIPVGSCSTLVHYLASHLLTANCAYDPDEETGEDKPDLSKFWQDAAPILLEACQVDGRQHGWSPERLQKEISVGLSKLATAGLNFRQELEQDEQEIPLRPEEEVALRELLRKIDQSGGPRVLSPVNDPVPMLTNVAQEIVELQTRAETFQPEELDKLIFDTLSLIRSLPPQFVTPLSVATDKTLGGLPSLSVNSDNKKISENTIVHSIRERIIARLDLSDFEQVEKGFQLIRYLPRINSTNGAISELFTELFSGLPPERLLALPGEIARIQADKNPNYPWGSFSPKDFERSLANAAISSLQAQCLLEVAEPTKFFEQLQSVLRDISPDEMPAKPRSNLFRHAVDLLMQAPEVERPYYGYLASSLILDYAVQRRIRGGFLEQLVQSKPIAEMVEMTTSQVAKHGLSDFLQVVQALDRKATSPQEHKLIFNTLLNLTTTHRRESIKAATVIIGAELFAHLAKQNDRASVTGILLKTEQDDSPLRTQIARTWLSANEHLIGERLSEIAKEGPRFDDLVDHLTKTDILSEQAELRRLNNPLVAGFESEEFPLIKMPTPEGLLRAMYTLSQQERIVLARELLLGKSGLLSSDRGRSALHQMLIESSVKGDDGSRIISDAVHALLATGDTVKLAEGLVPLVAERICRPPATDPGWREESQRALRENRLIETDIIANLKRASKSDQPDQSPVTMELDWIKEALCSDRISDIHRASIFQKFVPPRYSEPRSLARATSLTKEAVGAFLGSSEGEAWLKTLLQSSSNKHAHAKRQDIMKALLVPTVRKCLTQMMSRPYRRELDGLSNGSQDRLETLEQLAKAPRPIVTDVKRNSIDFIAQFAPKMGTPTVRMAQVGAQLLPLSPEDQRKLSGVFDSTEPQLACSAWNTLSRAEPNIANQLTQFGPRIGGGSLNSVFYAEHPDFGAAVVKVLVPQAVQRATSTFSLLKETQQAMEYDNSTYKLGRQLVDLADSWVSGELGDTTYDQDDTDFRTRFQGKKYAGLEIYVPKRLSTNTATVRVEEFVAGDNLTKLVGMSPDLAKRAVAAGFQCYIDQISGSMMDNMMGKPVLVLSDISPGNVRITEDGKKLAILDRAFYQHITVKDRLFLMAVLNTSDPAKLATTVATYLREEGKAPDDLGTATSRLTEILKKRLENGLDESLISFITVDAYTAGFTFPLRLQLIARGVAAWRQMALQAGFSSLQEARLFKA